MAKWLHPELFEDLDPQAMHQEFIDRYCPGLNFDVYRNGTFAYPPLSENSTAA
jgi:iron complex transport system substrate-binding protein